MRIRRTLKPEGALKVSYGERLWILLVIMSGFSFALFFNQETECMSIYLTTSIGFLFLAIFMRRRIWAMSDERLEKHNRRAAFTLLLVLTVFTVFLTHSFYMELRHMTRYADDYTMYYYTPLYNYYFLSWTFLPVTFAFSNYVYYLPFWQYRFLLYSSLLFIYLFSLSMAFIVIKKKKAAAYLALAGGVLSLPMGFPAIFAYLLLRERAPDRDRIFSLSVRIPLLFLLYMLFIDLSILALFGEVSVVVYAILPATMIAALYSYYIFRAYSGVRKGFRALMSAFSPLLVNSVLVYLLFILILIQNMEETGMTSEEVVLIASLFSHPFVAMLAGYLANRHVKSREKRISLMEDENTENHEL